MNESSLSVKLSTQLAIFMENRPGSLAQACEAIARRGINVDALATEGEGFGSEGGEMLVRMVVSDANKAVMALAEEGAVAVKTDVLTIEGENRPGVLCAIARRLADADINIESVYLSSSPEAARCTVILRPSDVEKAQRVLRDLQISRT